MMRTIAFLLAVLVVTILQAQNPERFEKEVQQIVVQNENVNSENLILFTGSSSIRFWKSLSEDFPNHNVLNNGFGGSEMSDLLRYANDLVIQYQPKQVFIYEGDNDIAAGRSLEQIMKNAKDLAQLIKTQLPQCDVVFISAKPSIARQSMFKKYRQFNGMLNQWCTENGMTFIDVWPFMLDQEGKLREDIFREDKLHMNATGYAIWKDVVRPYLK